MKKRIVVLLCMGLTLSFLTAGCGKKEQVSSETASDAWEEDATEVHAVQAEYEIAPYDAMDYVKLGEYKGIAVDYVMPQEIDEERVLEEIDNTLIENAEYNEITDRKSQMDDWINIDYLGKIDGKEFEGGSAEAYELQIGSGEFIEDFENQLVGLEAGDEKDMSVKFPKDYPQDEEIAGKTVDFHITVNEVYERKVPELTDEFVQNISEKSKNVEAYKEEVRQDLEQKEQKNSKNAAKEEALNKVLEDAEMTGYPDDLFKACYDSTMAQYQSYADMFGMEYEKFMAEYMDMDEEEVKQAAQQQVKEILVTKAIVKAEGLELSDKKYQQRLQETAEEYGYASGEDMKEDGYSDFMIDAGIYKKEVLDYLYKNAQIQEISKEEYDEKTGIAAEETKEGGIEEETSENE